MSVQRSFTIFLVCLVAGVFVKLERMTSLYYVSECWIVLLYLKTSRPSLCTCQFAANSTTRSAYVASAGVFYCIQAYFLIICGSICTFAFFGVFRIGRLSIVALFRGERSIESCFALELLCYSVPKLFNFTGSNEAAFAYRGDRAVLAH